MTAIVPALAFRDGALKIDDNSHYRVFEEQMDIGFAACPFLLPDDASDTDPSRVQVRFRDEDGMPHAL